MERIRHVLGSETAECLLWMISKHGGMPLVDDFATEKQIRLRGFRWQPLLWIDGFGRDACDVRLRLVLVIRLEHN